jgi:hypothetical protein
MLVVLAPNAAVTPAAKRVVLAVVIVGALACVGAVGAVCAKAGSVAANIIANSVFFILFAPGFVDRSRFILLFGSCCLIRR